MSVRQPRPFLLAVIVLAVGGVAAGAVVLGGPPSHPAVKVQVTQSDTVGAGSPSPSPAAVTPSTTASAGGALPTTPPRAVTIAPRPAPTTTGPTPAAPAVQSSPAASPTPQTTMTACPLNAECAPPKPPEGPPSALQLNDSSNGTTVIIASRGQIQVTLASTYWMFDPPSNPSVLAVQGPRQVAPCPYKTVPGSGCGTATMTFIAEAAGTSTISAHRTSCGEALLCTGDQGSFSVTVVVQ